VVVDKNNEIVVAGYFSGTVDFGGGPLTSAGLLDIFVAKYSSTGAHIWSKRFGANYDDVCYGVAVDGAGNVFITGGFKGTVSFGGTSFSAFSASDFFLAKYSAAGAHMWSRTASGSGAEFGLGLAVDANGDVVATGSFNVTVDFGGGIMTTAGTEDIYLAKFSGANGSHVWSKSFGSTYSDSGTGVVVDANNNIIVTGSFSGTVNFGGSPISTTVAYTDTFLAQFSASGAHNWSKRLGASTGYGKAIAVDASRNVVVTGYFQGTANFDGQSLTSSVGSSDVFVSKYSPTGAHVWTERFGGTSSDIGYGIAADLNGNVMVTGSFQGSADFGGVTLTSPGTYDCDIFLLELEP